MTRTAKLYIGVVGVVGTCLGLYVTWDFFFHGGDVPALRSVNVFVTLVFIYWLCCCLPLYIRPDCTVDMSFISILAITLLLGPRAAVVVSFITYPLVVVPAERGGGYIHVFNTAPWKTFFNLGNHTISFFAAGLAYQAAGGVAGDIALPGVLVSAAAFIFISTAMDALILLIHFITMRSATFYPTIFQMILSLGPSIICSAPIGYFLAMILQMEAGLWLALLFMLPLSLARFSFKLFLNSQRQQFEIVSAFSAAIDAKDPYTRGHSQRVSVYAVRIAGHLKLSQRRTDLLRRAALLHDVGKIGIPDAVLLKPGKLTDKEWEIIKTHPETGARIIGNIDTYQDISELVLHHHEYYDGNGYPGASAGDSLCLEAYILSAADAYDAITSDRPYRKGLSPERAAAIMQEASGTQFHPRAADAVVELVESGQLSAPISEAELAAAR